MSMAGVALRMDDVGASSKEFEQYSKFGPGNLLFLKRTRPFRAWARYRELDDRDWSEILSILERKGARLTVAITACWVEFDGALVPFPEKFAREAVAIKEGVTRGILEIANHGLTHCVIEGGLFRPRAFSGNRQFHREFWPWIDAEKHFEHMRRSQEILESYFGVEITTFVPPGNVFTEATIEAAAKAGIRTLNCKTREYLSGGVRVLSEDNVAAFHDRDIVMNGPSFLERVIEGRPPEFVFVKDLM